MLHYLSDGIVLFLICYAGLVVPDVPLEETETLRKEAKKNGIELVCKLPLKFSLTLFLDFDRMTVMIWYIWLFDVIKVLLTTPTTPTNRMEAIADVAEGFLYLVRASVNYAKFSCFSVFCINHFIYLIYIQVSSLGVTGTRASISGKVEALLKEIKEVCLAQKYIHLTKSLNLMIIVCSN